ncbi:MAG: tetratricopeptide repeat protein [Spirochaetaceae bacterium]|jgi:tetratricopeptide (TPR) repeat protein|nr:tetratricopeptide repeat protein [Spirochaetaceae bacterium]
MVKKIALTTALFFLGAFLGAAQDAFSRGEELFLRNKPQEALPLLEAAAAEENAPVKAALYLGIAYQQLDRPDEAIAVFRKILPRAGDETARIAFNLGNVYYTKGDFETARQYYTQAIDADPAYGPAYLNRANALISKGTLREALADYELYLSLEPRSAKRPRIEQMVALLREEFAAEERRRLQAEAAARAEAERRQRLMEEAAAALRTTAEESTGFSAGSEEVQGYDDEFQLE